MRDALSLPISVLAGALAAAAMTTLLAVWGGLSPDDSVWFVFLVAFAVSFVLVLVAGIPVAFVLRHRGRFTAGWLVASGALVGGMLACLPFVPGLLTPEPLAWSFAFGGLAVGSLIGACGAGGFWLAHRLMSPNNSSKPTPLRGAA